MTGRLEKATLPQAHPFVTAIVSVFLIPGLGATKDLFAEYQFPFPSRTVDYPAPRIPAVGLSEYALQLIADNGIQPGDSLIGVSLGGMISCEIAAHMFISQLTLVSSCTDSVHLVPFFRKMRQLSRVVPWRLMQKVPFPAFVLSRHRRMALAMFRLADANFIRWACLNAATWKSPAVHHDMIQIHGDRDPLFPVALQKIDHVIEGGDHLMILSHRAEIQPLLIARHQSPGSVLNFPFSSRTFSQA